MDSSSSEKNPHVKGLPLFMTHHTVTENSLTFPRAGVDFVYDVQTQKAVWSNPDSTTKWSPTDFSDTKPDGYDYVAANFVAGE